MASPVRSLFRAIVVLGAAVTAPACDCGSDSDPDDAGRADTLLAIDSGPSELDSGPIAMDTGPSPADSGPPDEEDAGEDAMVLIL